MSAGPLPAFAHRVEVPMLLHDPETGAILDANAAAEELYGYTAAELKNLSVGALSTDSSRFTQREAERRIQNAAAGEEQTFEWQVETRDGEVCRIRVHLEPLPIDGEVFVLAQVRDVTEFQRRTRRLQLLYRVIRHNLRNDMAKIMGYAGNLKEVAPTEEARRQAERIEDISGTVGHLVDSITHLETIARNDETDRSPTEVVTVLEELARSFEDRYPEATVVVDGEEAWVSADQGLHFALENAIENAIVHNDADRPRVECRVTVDSDAETATITVSDDGPPIPEMELEALSNVDQTTELNHGTGIGLFAMKTKRDK